MASFRSRLILLVAAAVLVPVVILVLQAGRVARVEFEASVENMREYEPPLDEAAANELWSDGGWEALISALESATGSGPGSWSLIAVTPEGELLAATDSAWSDAEVTVEADGTIRIRREGPDGIGEMRFRGGWALRGPQGDTVALAVPVGELPDRSLSLTGRPEGVETFTRDFTRRLWIGALLILVVFVGAALLLTDRLLGPLRSLERAARKLETGDLSTRVGDLGLREMDEVGGAFDAMAESLERSERARRRLIRDVAHELRTPLNNLRGTVESVQDGLRPADAATLEGLHDEVRVLERLVSDLGELARADADRLDLAIEPLAVASEVGGVVERFERGGRLDRAEVTLDLPDELRVLADPVRLAQIVGNLIENALVHAGPAVAIGISARRVGRMVEVSVTDDGPGIAPEHRARVFDRLYRVDPARSRKTGGRGLGLAIVRELVRAQGGEVELDSPVKPESAGDRGGVRVRFTLREAPMPADPNG